jgi:hypothetical protein
LKKIASYAIVIAHAVSSNRSHSSNQKRRGLMGDKSPKDKEKRKKKKEQPGQKKGIAVPTTKG